MRFVAKLIFYFFSNIIALIAAAYFIKGFEISPGLNSFLLAAAVLTLINTFFRPILKLILAPVIVLTLGLGIFLVNALMLYFLDKLLIDITITGIVPLIYATLIISLVNLVIHFSAKRAYKDNP
jgi:putative membrane protein